MGGDKILKDPIYGYIKIPTDYMYDIVDTSSFQRLRRVIQTSYSPLYSSAVHNRFVHSLGVYHLGRLVFSGLKRELIKHIPSTVMDEMVIDRYGGLFLLACLLHDVGHAPFSHTGEAFYLNKGGEYTELHSRLIEVVNEEDFKRCVPDSASRSAAPHEIMSVIVAINEYGNQFQDAEERSFFARCITGYKYQDGSQVSDIKNCFISLLNSKVIDVDKLDYLIRDAFVTGYNTVDIDYERLLNSITVVEVNSTRVELAYYKNAVSVIENVVYAHDAERKWIQNHPIILYENYLLQKIFVHIQQEMDNGDVKLFSEQTLSSQGQQFEAGMKICLLSDDDIIFLMKNHYPDACSYEYFERKSRRHPVWKSEAEYKANILDYATGGRILDQFEETLEYTVRYLKQNSDSWIIDEHLIMKLELEIQKVEESSIDEVTKTIQLEDKKRILDFAMTLKAYAEEVGLEFDFVVLMASQFNSGFRKPDFSKTNIVFDYGEERKAVPFGSIAASYQGTDAKRDKYFHLFYKRNESKPESINVETLCRELLSSSLRRKK